jgi:hypothetical protein
LNDESYQYDYVIHERNFVSPEDPTIHTQNIENLWLHVKRKLKYQFGTNEELMISYLYEFMFRKKFGRTIFLMSY